MLLYNQGEAAARGSSPQGGQRTVSRFLAIAIGGALGALARYGVGSLISNRAGSRFPYATFVINITACFVIGFIVTYLARRPEINSFWRYLVPVGFVGAYSTFSTFELEIFVQLETSAFLPASLYVLGSLLVGLLAVWFGVVLGRAVS